MCANSSHAIKARVANRGAIAPVPATTAPLRLRLVSQSERRPADDPLPGNTTDSFATTKPSSFAYLHQ
jgi:hypothetical protein